jgi:hypothetical protein
VRAALAALVAFALCACGSGGAVNGAVNGALPGDAGPDARGDDGGSSVDSSGVDAGDASGTMLAPSFDGTVGNPCTTDAECVPDGGPAINRCSNSLSYQVGPNATTNLYPTPVCLVPPGPDGANCDPAPSTDPTGGTLHYCDGPDDPSSPGLCVPLTAPTASGRGQCLPKCTLALDGSAPHGCVGSDACLQFTPEVAPGAATFGLGYCRGNCNSDSDCSALGSSFVCDAIAGVCTTQLQPAIKQLGDTCTLADTKSGACTCLVISSSTGYCSSACVVGGPVCPDGWICDSLQPSLVPDGNGGATRVTAPSQGAAGFCVIPCTHDDAGTPACPDSLSCQSVTPAGPDCLP